MKKIKTYVISIIFLLLLWYMISFIISDYILPDPLKSIKALINLSKDEQICWHFFASSKRIVLASFFACIFAIPLGLLLGTNKNIDKIIGPSINILYPIPKVVFLPIFVVIMGIGDMPKIFLIGLVVFFQMILIVKDAIKHIPYNLKKSMDSLNPTKGQYLKHLVLPFILPEILSGLRSTIAISIALLFITENFAAINGLGYFITTCMDTRDFENMYAGIMLLAFLGLILYEFLYILERKICKWKYINEK